LAAALRYWLETVGNYHASNEKFYDLVTQMKKEGPLVRRVLIQEENIKWEGRYM
jgi:hypothetical protein